MQIELVSVEHRIRIMDYCQGGKIKIKVKVKVSGRFESFVLTHRYTEVFYPHWNVRNGTQAFPLHNPKPAEMLKEAKEDAIREAFSRAARIALKGL